jgi:hypothetical protein
MEIYAKPQYKVYDFVEMLYRNLWNSGDRDRATRWQALINDYFLEAGVGWRMVDGLLESRGPEAFVTVVDAAQNALNEAKLPTARQEIHEALRDLSRRPEPDLTGAIQHAIAALECTAREATGDIRATLGEVLKRYPDLLPKPIDEAASRLWGYASEMARHLREGRAPARPEAEVQTWGLICSRRPAWPSLRNRGVPEAWHDYATVQDLRWRDGKEVYAPLAKLPDLSRRAGSVGAAGLPAGRSVGKCQWCHREVRLDRCLPRADQRL